MTDLVMPRMSGCALAETPTRVRAGMRVLYMSGYTTEAIVGEGVLDRSVEFIAKPFTAVDLAAKVREVLDRP